MKIMELSNYVLVRSMIEVANNIIMIGKRNDVYPKRVHTLHWCKTKFFLFSDSFGMCVNSEVINFLQEKFGLSS